jgi:hypothetical protein
MDGLSVTALATSLLSIYSVVNRQMNMKRIRPRSVGANYVRFIGKGGNGSMRRAVVE